MHVAFLHLPSRTAIRADGKVDHIEIMLDETGQVTDDHRAASVFVLRQPNGEWFSDMIDIYDMATIQ